MSTQRQRQFGWKQIRVTSLVIVGLLVLVFAAYQVGKIFDVFASRYELVTLVPNVAGLREGSPVTLAGQRIGQVSSIEYIPVEQKVGNNNLRVVLAVSEEVGEQIRRDSRISCMRTRYRARQSAPVSVTTSNSYRS